MTIGSLSQIERFEEAVWADMYGAAPPHFAREMGLDVQFIGPDRVFFCQRVDMAKFNMVFTLGLNEPAADSHIDEIIIAFTSRQIRRFYVHYAPDAQPANLPELLNRHGLTVRSGWDRIYQSGSTLPAPLPLPQPGTLHKVTRANRGEWADFVCGLYRLPFQPWLHDLVNRPGWHSYVLENEGRIIAARTMYLRGDWAWMGIDAPIPGIMTQHYDPDYWLFRQLLADGLAQGARHFIADIEKPDDAQQLPAYEQLNQLGFQVRYRRLNYMLT